MKSVYFKLSSIIILTFYSSFLFAQVVGSSNSGVSPLKDIKAGELNNDALKGDVSLTNGTFNTTQHIGTVSTPSGLSYSVDLNYSSTTAGGDNIPSVCGVPYGEGWNIGVPTISYSSKTYGKYGTLEQAKINSRPLSSTSLSPLPDYDDLQSSHPHCTDRFTIEDVRKENTVYWSNPVLSIPGIINERLIFKYTEDDGGTLVYMPERFETFIEARYNGNNWIVTLNDGTDYYFEVVQMGTINPTNQRVFTDPNTDEEHTSLVDLLAPKREILCYYCSKIKNSNHPNGQAIKFQYQKFGGFNFYKEFSPNIDFSSDRDIFLEDVTAYDNNMVFERLDLQYGTVAFDDGNGGNSINNLADAIRTDHDYNFVDVGNTNNMLILGQDGVGRFDSLYNSKVVYELGTNNIGDWYRYLHAKHPWINWVGINTEMTNPLNPYEGGVSSNNSVFRMSVGTYPSSIYTPPSSGIPFYDSYLESERIDGAQYAPGDIYEIKTQIQDHRGVLPLCNFDINICTGSKSLLDPTADFTGNGSSQLGMEAPKVLSYQEMTTETVFSTFGNAFKWDVYTHYPSLTYLASGTFETSNLFVMPKLPSDYDGFHIQVGPANSDNYFSAEPDVNDHLFGYVGTIANPNLNFSSIETYSVLSFYTYINEMLRDSRGWNPAPEAYSYSPYITKDRLVLNSEGSLARNFGIGLPWHMMRNFYQQKKHDFVWSYSDDDIADPKDDEFKFWWRYFSSSSNALSSSPRTNRPTLTNPVSGDDVTLNSLQLIRYSKNPYMLKRAVFYKTTNTYEFHNTYVDNYLDSRDISQPSEGLSPVSALQFEYDVVVDELVDNDTRNTTGSLSGTTNIFLLTKIITFPVEDLDESLSTLIENCPITKFEYDFLPNHQSAYVNLDLEDYYGASNINACSNADIIVMQKITNSLGGETEIEYNDEPIIDIIYLPTIQLCQDQTSQAILTDCGSYESYMPKGQLGLQILATVKTKKITDEIGFKIWDYTYSGSIGKDGFSLMDVQQFISNYTADNGTIRNGGGSNHQFCYQYVTVSEPDIDNLGNPSHTIYENHIDHPRFGKIKEKKIYDSQSNLISSTLYEYNNYEAYHQPANSYVHLRKCELEETAFDLFEATSEEIYNHAGKVGCYELTFKDDIDYGAFTDIWFTAIKRQTDRNYEPSLSSDPSSSYFRTGETTGDGYRTDTSNYITDTTPDSLIGDSSFRQVGMPLYIETVTEYDYFDASYSTHGGTSYYGLTSSQGFRNLLPQFTGSDYTLPFEPSFGLWRKKTWSPQLTDVYQSEETYYYYDLNNYFGTSNIVDAMSIEALRTCLALGIRNMPYENRTIGKVPGEDEVSRSDYYIYDAWEPADFHMPTMNYVNISGPGCSDPPPPPPPPPPSGGNPAPPDPCARIYGNHFTINETQPPVEDGNEENITWRETEPGEDPCDPNSSGRVASFFELDTIEGGDFAFRDLNWAGCYPEQFSGLYFVYLKNVIHQVDNGNELTPYQNLSSSLKTSIPLLRFELGSSGYSLVYPYENFVGQTITKRNYWGQVAEESDENGLVTNYQFEDITRTWYTDNNNPCNSYIEIIKHHVGVPLSVTVGYGLSDALTTAYTYNDKYNIESETSPNNNVMHYFYEKFGRQSEVKEGNKTLQTFSYHIWDKATSDDFYSRAAKNYIETRVYINSSTSEGEVARQYTDPLGRNYCSLKYTSNDLTSNDDPVKIIYSGEQVYDLWNRVTKTYIPFEFSGAASVSVIPRTNSSASMGLVFSEQMYESNLRSRVLKSAPNGEDIQSGHFKEFTYGYVSGMQTSYEIGLNSNLHNLLFPGNAADYVLSKQISTDEDGKININYSNAFGQKIASSQYADDAFTQQLVTLFIYDSQGNLKKVINPERQETNNYFNLMGWLYKKETVDGGQTLYIYDKSGNIVIEQDADNAHANLVRQYEYDIFGRITGQVLSTSNQQTAMTYLNPHQSYSWFLSLNSNNYASLFTADKTEKLWFYDNNNDPLDLRYHSNIKRYLMLSRTGMAGMLSHTISHTPEGLPFMYTFYSYFNNGNLKWEIQQVNPAGIQVDNRGIPVRIDYPDYNLRNTQQTKTIDVNCDRIIDFQVHHTFDKSNRLQNVYSGFTNNKALNDKIATNSYYDATNVLAATNYFIYDPAPSISDFVPFLQKNLSFDDRLRLTSIGHNPEYYNEYIDYDDNTNYSENYNGNINNITHQYLFACTTNNNDISSAGFIGYEPKYDFTYDACNRLTLARYDNQSTSPAFTSGSEGYSYDYNGNILDLTRQELNATSSSQFIYGYQTGTNRLLSADTRNYAYSYNGNLISDSYRNLQNIKYGWANLPHHMQIPQTSDATNIDYLYNAKDERAFKFVTASTVDHEGNSGEFYLKDASGTLLGINEFLHSGKWTWHINGQELIAKVKPPDTQQPERLSDDAGNYADIDTLDADIAIIIDQFRRADSLGFEFPDTLFYIELGNGSKCYMLASILRQVQLTLPFSYTILEELVLEDNEQMISLYDANQRVIPISVAEMRTNHDIIHLNDDNIIGVLDPFYLTLNTHSNTIFESSQATFYTYDHLGNTRVTYKPTTTECANYYSLDIQTIHHYFPYGRVLKEYVAGEQEKFLTTYHERDAESGLDYRGARFYDADVARFLSLDPKATCFSSWSPYNYVLGNPILLLDPDGRFPQFNGVRYGNTNINNLNRRPPSAGTIEYNRYNPISKNNSLNITLFEKRGATEGQTTRGNIKAQRAQKGTDDIGNLADHIKEIIHTRDISSNSNGSISVQTGADISFSDGKSQAEYNKKQGKWESDYSKATMAISKPEIKTDPLDVSANLVEQAAYGLKLNIAIQGLGESPKSQLVKQAFDPNGNFKVTPLPSTRKDVVYETPKNY